MFKNLSGALFILISVSLYGLYGVYSKLIGITFGVFASNYARSLFLILILLPIFVFNRKLFKPFTRKDYKWVVIWSTFAGIPMFLSFIAFNNLPLGTTYFLLYSTMILGGFLAGKSLFGERLNLVKIISLALTLFGLSLVYSFGMKASQSIYVGSALLSGLLTGIWNTASKKLSGKYSDIQLVFVTGVAILMTSVFFALVLGEPFPQSANLSQWCWVAAYAITQVFAIYFLIKGFKHLEAQIGSLLMPMEVVFASLFGLLFFGEVLQTQTYIGGLIIAVSSILPNIALPFSKIDNKYSS